MKGEMNMTRNLYFSKFFPNVLHIIRVDSYSHVLKIKIESVSKKAICPKCKKISSTYHGKRLRKNVSDLPFLDYSVFLNITLKEYVCPEDGIFSENPDNFLIPRKSITTRCQNYLSSIKHILDGNISTTCIIANSAHIPVDRGVIRYIPTNVDICESDKLWIYEIMAKMENNLQKCNKKELLQYIHENCERELHPNLVELSLCDLTNILSVNITKKDGII